jgi:hypothetical protein
MMKRYIHLMLVVFAFIVCAGQAVANQPVALVLPSGVRVVIIEMPFDRATFKISGCEGGDHGCIINGHVPFGSDNEIPKTFTKSITATYQDKSYSLDVSDMFNAWGTRPLEVKGAVRYFGGKCRDAKNCELRGIFSDGAGSYVAEWQIIHGVPFRTILTNSDDVVNLFIHHIDPPEIE